MDSVASTEHPLESVDDTFVAHALRMDAGGIDR